MEWDAMKREMTCSSKAIHFIASVLMLIVKRWD